MSYFYSDNIPEETTHSELTGSDIDNVTTWFNHLKNGSAWSVFVGPKSVSNLTEQHLHKTFDQLLKTDIYSHKKIL